MIGIAIMAVCMTAMAFTFWRSMGRRSQAMSQLHGPLAGGQINDGTPGTSGQITDGGVVPAQALLGCMCWRKQQDEDYELPDEGVGNMLGLVYHRYRLLSDTWIDPTVYDGTRSDRQVWIRLGQDGDSIRGAGANARRLRTIVAVRASVGRFEAIAENGRLKVVDGGGPELDALFAAMAPSPDAWHDLRIVGGADGIVTSRAIAGDFIGGWIYDLWLLEHLAAHGQPLAPVELGREWEPPYGMNNWAPSFRESVSAVSR